MNEIAWGCGLFACLATLLHFTSASLAIYRARRGAAEPSFSDIPPANLPPVSVLRPVRGLDPFDELTLRSGFELDYARYELILCCDDADDAVVPVIRRLIGVLLYLTVKRRFWTGWPSTRISTSYSPASNPPGLDTWNSLVAEPSGAMDCEVSPRTRPARIQRAARSVSEERPSVTTET